MTKSCRDVAATLILAISVISCTQESEAPDAERFSSAPEPLRVEEVRALVLDGQFAAAEEILETALASFERDIVFEEHMYLLLDQFYRPMPELQVRLTEWVNTQDSANARLARGVYYTAMGWQARGFAYRSSTSKDQFQGMKEYFDLALADLALVIDRRSTDLFARCYAMDILMSYGAHDALKDLLDAALDTHPLSLTPRWFYLNSLEPRWGGSFQQMGRLVADSRKFYARNPRLRALEGRVTAALANDAMSAGEHEDALRLYDRALSEGGAYWYYFAGRGEAHMRLNRYEEAIEDLSQAQTLRPDYPSTVEYLGWSKYRLRRFEDAVPDLTNSIELGERTARQYSIRADSYKNLNRLEEALADFTLAAELDPTNDSFRHQRDAISAILRQEDAAPSQGAMPPR